MPDILFLPLDNFANAPADAFPSPTADDSSDAADAVRASHDGRAAALAGQWDAAAASFLASAARRAALVARGAAGPAVAARGWSDVAVCAAARDHAVDAADALARARAVGGEAGAGCAATRAALAEVATWLDGLARQEPPTIAPWEMPIAWAPAPEVPPPTVEAQDLLAELATEFETALAESPVVTAPAFGTRAVPDVAGIALAGVTPAGVASADTEWADTEWAPWAADGAPAPDVAATLPDASPAPTSVETPDASSAPELPWLELEAPLRPWERATGATPNSDAGSALGAACAVPVRAAPLAPPLAPALRNAKIDEVVALATAAPEPRTGRLGSLFRRLTRA